MFISKDNNLNKAHIKYLENHLYILAKESKRYEIVNSNVPTEASISEMDRAEMDEFIDNMRLILGVLGHKILEPSIKRKSDEKEILYILIQKISDLVQSVQKYSPTEIVRVIKSITEREVFARCRDVKKKLWGGKLWLDGFYVATVSVHGNEEV